MVKVLKQDEPFIAAVILQNNEERDYLTQIMRLNRTTYYNQDLYPETYPVTKLEKFMDKIRTQILRVWKKLIDNNLPSQVKLDTPEEFQMLKYIFKNTHFLISKTSIPSSFINELSKQLGNTITIHSDQTDEPDYEPEDYDDEPNM